jgi:HAD superfamily hydrolase (TIGR01509 family)
MGATASETVNSLEREKAVEVLSSVGTVIFDMDGLMIDSEPVHQKAYDAVLQRFGKGLTEEENNRLYVGISDKDITEDLVQRHGLPVSPAELEEAKHHAYLELVEHILPQEGLMELLNKLQDRNYKMAIASSSPLSHIQVVLDALHAGEYFSAYFSAEQVEHGKPAPHLFLLAAQEIGSNPAQCLVLEDAPSGIAAAKAASMYSFAIPSRETKGADFSNATVRLNSLVELAELVV